MVNAVYFQAFKENNDLFGVEHALLHLRSIGATMGESVMVVKTVLLLSLPEADSLVLGSEAWRDERETTYEMREKFISLLVQATDENE